MMQDTLTDKPLTPSLNHFPVVGVGASSGGLDAFKKLLKGIPENSGMAYVLVQHLEPKHDSMLAELLQKITTIPVLEITDDIKVEPNHIYIIPSNKMLLANDGVLELSPRPAPGNGKLNLPIDLFFSSLAEVHQSHAIGVVLSGTGSDGTAGLKAIKDYDGITFAQDQYSAAYPGMPMSAVKAGAVDFILSPEKIPEKILEVNRSINGEEKGTLPQKTQEIFRQIILMLRLRKGTDFTYYKQTTIRRRILRRMALNKNKSPEGYLIFLKENTTEQDLLYQDLLISVTSFFRDYKTFDNLCEKVFPQLIKNKKHEDPIRIWVAGCSTGQEAYSIAICLKEFLGYQDGNADGRIQIFASDISEPAIIKARLGIYNKSELDGLSPQRLQEFFTHKKGVSQVNKSIREMCVFTVHNFLKDPPFSKIDFISCRNVLIYLEPYLQKKALTTFHYALNTEGFLLLGKSETISSVPGLFASAIKYDKLFTPKDVPTKYVYNTPQAGDAGTAMPFQQLKTEIVRNDFQKMADDIMLREYTPAGVVVNEAMDIVHFRGQTRNYLEQLPGKPSHNILKMAKQGLAFELRNLLNKAKKEKKLVIKERIPVKTNGSLHNVTIEAIPLHDTIDPHYLVLFKEVNVMDELPADKGDVLQKGIVTTGNQEQRIAQLEKELLQAREDMRMITEDQEAANEELQSVNEELLSGSEELQSLNEEMETSKEELQSTNQELTVVNQEMVSLTELLTKESDFSEAIVATVREPLLVLDKKLRVKMANNAFYKTFKLTEADTENKLIYDIGGNQWNIPELKTLLENILPQKTILTDFELVHSFTNIGERILLLNAREMTKGLLSEKMMLLAIEDITDERAYKLAIEAKEKKEVEQRIEMQKKMAAAYKSGYEFMQNVFMQTPAVICIFKGPRHVYRLANEMYMQLVGHRQIIGKPIREALPEVEGQPFYELLDEVYKTGKPYKGNETPLKLDRGKGKPEDIFLNFTYQPTHDAKGKVDGIILLAIDVTELVVARKKIEQSEHRYHEMISSSPSLIAIFKGEEMTIEIANDAIIESWGKGKDIIGKSLLSIMPEIIDQGFTESLSEVYKTGIPYHAYEAPVTLVRNGKQELMHYTFIYQAQRNINGAIEGVAIIANEVTPQALLNINLKESEQRFRSLADNVPIHIFITEPSATATISYWNKNWLDYTGQCFAEAIGDSWEKLIHPDDLRGILDIYVPAFENRQPYHLPAFRVKRYDGVYRWHEVQSNPRYLPNGVFIGYIGIGVDINEKKLAEDALKVSETHFRYMADLMPAKISNADPQGNVLYFNKQWLDFTGLDFNELKDLGYYTIMHPDELEEFQQRFQSASETGTELEMEMRFLNKDGQYKWHLNIAKPVKDENGGIRMWVGATTEIQKIKEEEHRKGDFIKMVSHELKTPVTSIKGYVQMLLMMLDDEHVKTSPAQLKNSLVRVDYQVTRLTRLITEMLDLSRIEADRLELAHEIFNLSTLTKNVIEDIFLTHPKHTIALVADFESPVYGDKGRIEQVLINLITNAIKNSTSSQGIEISIEKAPNNMVAVSVKDSGIGIDKSAHQKIFDRFYRVEGKLEQTFAGFGIGLFIVKEIIERHNGSISVESEKGQGSVFTFTLPLATEQQK